MDRRIGRASESACGHSHPPRWLAAARITGSTIADPEGNEFCISEAAPAHPPRRSPKCKHRFSRPSSSSYFPAFARC